MARGAYSYTISLIAVFKSQAPGYGEYNDGCPGLKHKQKEMMVKLANYPDESLLERYYS